MHDAVDHPNPNGEVNTECYLGTDGRVDELLARETSLVFLLKYVSIIDYFPIIFSIIILLLNKLKLKGKHI